MEELITVAEKETVDTLIRVMKHNIDMEKKMTAVTGGKTSMYTYTLEQLQDVVFNILALKNKSVGTYNFGLFSNVFESGVSIWDFYDYLIARNSVRARYVNEEIDWDRAEKEDAKLKEKYGITK